MIILRRLYELMRFPVRWLCLICLRSRSFEMHRVPILPVAIEGTGDIWPRAARTLRLRPAWIMIGEPFPPDCLIDRRASESGAKLAGVLGSLHNQLRERAGRTPFEYPEFISMERNFDPSNTECKENTMAEPIHGTSPMVIEETAGKKAYCQCGHSDNLPYCDGAHSRMQTGLAPIVCEVETDGRVAICQCRQSQNLPYCDGTHKTLR